MKTTKSIAVTALAIIAMILTSCTKDEEGPAIKGFHPPTPELSDAEKAGLVTLLETQKLHRDVYNWMDAQLGEAEFASLASHDARIMERLSVKVDKLGLDNPILDKAEGEFAESHIQAQYFDILRKTEGTLSGMIHQAKIMETALIIEVNSQKGFSTGNPEIEAILAELGEAASSQLKDLNDWEGHCYAIDPVKED